MPTNVQVLTEEFEIKDYELAESFATSALKLILSRQEPNGTIAISFSEAGPESSTLALPEGLKKKKLKVVVTLP